MMDFNNYRKKGIISYITISVLCILLFMRLQYGFDQTDESHYYALAKRFCQGDIPFINEWHPSQFFAILLCPFYSIYTFFVPSGDGVILAGRYTYFAIQIVVMLYLFYVLKDKPYKWQAMIIYLMCSRQNIPGLSYYNLFMSFSLIATFSLLRYFEKGKGINYIIITGICISLATVCMPFFAIGVATLTITLLIIGRRKEVLAMWFGILFCATIYIGFLLTRASLFAYILSMKYVLLNPSHVSTNFIYKSFTTILSIGKVCICGIPGFIYLLIRIKKISLKKISLHKSVSFEGRDNIIFLLSLILCSITSGIVKPGAVFLQITILSFPYIVNELGNIRKCNDKTNIEPVFLYFIGIAVAFLFWLGSDTGASCLPLGFVISVIGASILIEQSLFGKEKIIYCIILTALVVLPRLCGPTFRDNYWWKLNTKISYGPAKGLYTEQSDAEDYYQVCDLIDMCEQYFTNEEVSDKKILISAFLPWGYLYSNFRNGSMTTWTAPIENDMLITYYDLHPEHFPNVVIIIDDDFGNINGLDGGGKLYSSNPKNGKLWDQIKNYNSMSSKVGSVYWLQE